MTIIAIFAAITETSAAVSLPFLDNDDRNVYIWFLISFPFCLILLFFVTLNFNYKALYSPSDFGKAKHFLKIIHEAVLLKEAKAAPPLFEQGHQNHDSFPLGKDSRPPESKSKYPSQSFIRLSPMRYISPCNAQAPPVIINLFANKTVQDSVELEHRLHHLHIIDTRRIETKKGLETLVNEMDKTFDNASETYELIVFLANQKSVKLISQSELEELNTGKQRRSSYIIYNLSTLTLTPPQPLHS